MFFVAYYGTQIFVGKYQPAGVPALVDSFERVTGNSHHRNSSSLQTTYRGFTTSPMRHFFLFSHCLCSRSTLCFTEGGWAQSLALSRDTHQTGLLRRTAVQNSDLICLFWRQCSQINLFIPLSVFSINV